jgi:hypothetical protein
LRVLESGKRQQVSETENGAFWGGTAYRKIRLIEATACPSIDYLGPWILAQQIHPFGVLAQVTKRKPVPLREPAAKFLIFNYFWSHPPGLNRRPADYESTRVKSHV